MKWTSNKELNHLLYMETARMPSNFRFLALVLILIGGSLILINNYWGLTLIFPSIPVFLYKEGRVFDSHKVTMFNYSSIGFYLWHHSPQNIKDYKFLSIVRVGMVKKMYHKSISYQFQNTQYKLTLIKNEKEHVKVMTSDYYKVFSEAKKIARRFDFGLVDYSKGTANWVIHKD